MMLGLLMVLSHSVLGSKVGEVPRLTAEAFKSPAAASDGQYLAGILGTKREAVRAEERDPPQKAVYRFRAMAPREALRNFNNSLISNCPLRKLYDNDCVCGSAYRDVKTVVDIRGASAVVAVNTVLKQIVVSFGANVQSSNWLDSRLVDLPFAPAGTKVNNLVLQNYLESADRVLGHVKGMLDNFFNNGHSVLVTGYGVGGATAYIALPAIVNAVRSRSEPRDIQLITYSSPRVGNVRFAQYVAGMNVSVTRLTMAKDVVPRLPPRSLGYAHFGGELHEVRADTFGNYSITVCSQLQDEDPKCALGEEALVLDRHFVPFANPFPRPPYCTL